MTQNIFVYYNGNQLFPTPLVNYQQQPVEYGYIYGYDTAITLEGYFSGISTGAGGNYTATGSAISGVTGIFANQFGNLQVTDDVGDTLYAWTGVTVDSINLEPSLYFQGSFIKYSIKLMVYNLPSGVTEPSNNYAFTQNEDGTVNVSHKISARGVRYITGAFQNAISWVQQFTGKDPYSNCAPYFVPGGSGALLSLSENIDRAAGTYSVDEVYKYNTGSFGNAYTTVATLDMSDSIESEFRQINYNVKYQASPILQNLDSIINGGFNADSILADIQNQYNLVTTNWAKTNYSADINSGAATVDIKTSYVSGASPTGYFDFVLTNDNDLLTLVENWKIEGEFKCFGPLDYKLKQLNAFLPFEGNNNWRTYLTGLIINSPLFAAVHDSNKQFTQNMSVVVDTNTQLATLKLSLNLDMGYEPFGIADLKYTLSATPSRWVYELLPSANIEGNFIVQNLQVATQPVQEFTFTCRTNNKPSGIQTLSGYMNNITSVYVNSGTVNAVTAFLKEYSWSTGTYDVTYKQQWIGADFGVSANILNLQSLGTDTSSVPTRIQGYNFGY